MLTQQLDLLDGLIKISNQSTSQLHLIGEAPNTVMISCGQNRGFNSSMGSAQEVVVP
jgi:hypothetical protein